MSRDIETNESRSCEDKRLHMMNYHICLYLKEIPIALAACNFLSQTKEHQTV